MVLNFYLTPAFYKVIRVLIFIRFFVDIYAFFQLLFKRLQKTDSRFFQNESIYCFLFYLLAQNVLCFRLKFIILSLVLLFLQYFIILEVANPYKFVYMKNFYVGNFICLLDSLIDSLIFVESFWQKF